MNRKIYVSGMHSGQNPCAGIGIARSIRKAFPDLTLVGVDHWQGSSGLHESTIDEVLLLPQWNQINSRRHARFVRSLLDAGNLWISAIDMEVRWLAENVGEHENLLIPGARALEMTEKPAVRALEGAGFRVPEHIPATVPDSELHGFLRHSSWQCWLKSPYHDAKRVSSWGALERARAAMSKGWKTSRLFVQRNVFGNEESIAFAAYRGELIEAVHLEKRLLTPEGKTWAGQVVPADPETREHFRQAVREMNWSGGGELEYVRDPDGERWIIECNPRFPAWIYGGALAGRNLPAKLVGAVWGLSVLESVPRFPCFTRVVQEIPASEPVGLPLPPDAGTIAWVVDGKKGKGGGPANASLVPPLSGDEDEDGNDAPAHEPENVPRAFSEEVSRLARSFAGETPARALLEEWTASRFAILAKNIARSSGARGPEIRIGYSVKTSPTDAHLRIARKHGFLAECISQREVQRALAFGFAPREIILNGPGKFWPLESPEVRGLHMLFCDSVEEFDRVIERSSEKSPVAKVLGFRMKIPKLSSRFGNSLEDFENFRRISSRVKKIGRGAELGFHFHMPSWAIGVERWMEALRALLLWCQTLQKLSGVPVRHLDLGGGFFPADLEHLDFETLRATVGGELPEARALYFEPGRALTQDGEALVSRVLDVRRDPDGDLSEIVVDACIAELPLAQAYSHRVFYLSKKTSGKASGNTPGNTDDGFALLGKGRARILGRICMEDDILNAGVALPESVDLGDLVIFGDAGAYERTMSYEFGRG